MLKAIGWIVKMAVFSALVLIIGNRVHWRGKTISDQVRLQMSQAERSEVVTDVKKWATNASQSTPKGAGLSRLNTLKSEASSSASRAGDALVEKIPSSERQKLRALIQELNGSSKRD